MCSDSIMVTTRSQGGICRGTGRLSSLMVGENQFFLNFYIYPPLLFTTNTTLLDLDVDPEVPDSSPIERVPMFYIRGLPEPSRFNSLSRFHFLINHSL